MLELPFDSESESDGVTAELGQVMTAARWAPARSNSGNDGDSDAGGRRLAMLRIETLVSSAVIKMNPGGFDLLQGVHVRANVAVPMQGQTGVSRGQGDIDGRGSGATSAIDRDELLERLRDRCTQDETASLPARPILPPNSGVVDGGDGGDVDGVAPRAQLAVTVSPVRFRIAEPHIIDLTCFAVDASARLANISDILAIASPTSPQTTLSRQATRHARIDDDVAQQLKVNGEMALPSQRTSRASPRSGDVSSSGRQDDAVVLLPRDMVLGTEHEPEENQGPQVINREQGAEATPEMAKAAPILPPLLGTVVIETISVMLLTAPGCATGGDSRGSPRRKGVDCISRDHLRNYAVVPDVPCPSTHPDNFCASVLLELRGIGIGVDLARQPLAAGNEQPLPLLFPARDNGTKWKQHCLELAVKRITMTDMGKGSRGSLAQLVGTAGHCGEPTSRSTTQDNHLFPEVSTRGQGEDGGESERDAPRILPARWWCLGVERQTEVPSSGIHEDSSDYPDQLLVRANLCPVSNALSVETDLSSIHLMLLPVPILDFFRLVADVKWGTARRFRSRYHAGREENGIITETVNEHRRAGAGTFGQRDGRDRRRVESVSMSTLGENPETAAGNGDEQGSQRWQQAIRSLIGPAATGYLWLRRVDVVVSLRDLHVWLPDVDARVLPVHSCPTPFVGDSEGEGSAAFVDVNAIVASCDCSMALSVATSLLFDTCPESGTTSPSTILRQGDRGEEQQEESNEPSAAVSSSVHRENIEYGTRASTAAAERRNDLCVMKFGVHNLEVFVARPSLAQFGAPGLPRAVKAVASTMSGDDDASRGFSVAFGSVDKPLPSFSASVTHGEHRATAATGEHEHRSEAIGAKSSNSFLGSSFGKRLISSDDNDAALPSVDPPTGDSVVTGDVAANVSSNAGTPAQQQEEKEINVDGGGGDGGSGGGGDDDDNGGGQRQGSSNNNNSKSHCMILPFSVDLTHILSVNPSHSSVGTSISLLQSDMEVTVTQVQVRCFLDFPLATRVVTNSLMPLRTMIVQGDRDDEGKENRADHDGGVGRGRAEKCSENRLADVVTRARPSSQASGSATTHVWSDSRLTPEEGTDARGTEGLLAQPGSVFATPIVAADGDQGGGGGAVAGAATELVAMWTCRAKLKAAGLKMTVVNNFHRQSRPTVTVNVS